MMTSGTSGPSTISLPALSLQEPEYSRPTRTPFTAELAGVPLVIDNGSYHCRVGWASEGNPRLDFLNVVARPRHRTTGTTKVLVGPFDSGAGQLKAYDLTTRPSRSAFDSNVLYQLDLQESILDYAFDRLSLPGPMADHPVIITECCLNPALARAQLLEMLFEAYGVPAIHTGIDAGFAHAYNRKLGHCAENGMVVSSGFTATHIMPIIAGQPRWDACARLDVGGQLATEHLQKILTLRYPQHTAKLNQQAVQTIKEALGVCSQNYIAELHAIKNGGQTAGGRARVVQLPWSQVGPTPAEVAAEEARRAASRAANVQRLKDMANTRKVKVLAEKEAELRGLYDLLDAVEAAADPDQAKVLLSEAKLAGVSALHAAVAEAEQSLSKARQALLPRQARSESFGSLTDAAMHETATPKMQADAAPIQASDLGALEGSEAGLAELEQLKARHQAVALRIQERQRITLQYTSTGPAGRRDSGQRKRTKLLAEAASEKEMDDDFGMDDDDWDVYRMMDPQANGKPEIDSQDEAEYQWTSSRLKDLGSAHAVIPVELSVKGSEGELRTPAPPVARLSVAEDFQLHLTTERYRPPELLFQPKALAGIDQAGIHELVLMMLARMPAPQQDACVRGGVLLTGGNAAFHGLETRLAAELQSCCPVGSCIPVTRSVDMSLDAWRGAAVIAAVPGAFANAFTKVEYDECGFQYLRGRKSTLLIWVPVSRSSSAAPALVRALLTPEPGRAGTYRMRREGRTLAVLLGLLAMAGRTLQQAPATTINGSSYQTTDTVLPFGIKLYNIPTPVGRADPDVLITLEVRGTGQANVFCNPNWGQFADPLAPWPQPGLAVWSADESGPINQIWISRNDPQYRPPYASKPSQPAYTSYFPSFICLVLNTNAARSTTFTLTANLITNNNSTLLAEEQAALASIFKSCCPQDTPGACSAWKAQATNLSDGTQQPFTNFCSFPGQICGSNARLQRLDMTGYGLRCPYPAAQISKFVGLRTLSLGANPNMTGPVTGVFDSLTGMPGLFSLDLNGDIGLDGSLAGTSANASICTLAKDTGKDIEGSITGTAKAGLKSLLMESVGLTGSIPECLLAAGSSLAEIDLSYNALTGSIPDVIPAASAPLEVLTAYNNMLQGPLPASLANARYLSIVDLSNNNISGPIPAGVGDIEPLSQFVMEYNSLTGSVPASFASAPNLRIFDVKGNQLSTLPAAWVNNAAAPPQNSSLTIARLSFNNFTGPFPEGFSKLPLLQFLVLNNNSFSGPIKVQGQPVFPALRALNVSYNRLSGSIPSVLAQSGIFMQPPLFAGQNLIFQHVFDLSHNSLTGSIPGYLNATQVPVYALGGVYLGSNDLNVTCTNQTNYISDICNDGKPIPSPAITIAAPAPALSASSSAALGGAAVFSSGTASKTLSTGGIVGIVVGVVIAVAFAVLLAVFIALRRRRTAKPTGEPVMTHNIGFSSHNSGFSRFKDVELS
ncbi:hypothetical protein WJX72_002908 [[Myrmecia] bisecta]|uniref:Uncharacterized protein n=1 Tax=[Myrmecia] bisecta TaxID=41462 RepID=A0AAW1QEI6_9CHLO